MKVLMIKAVRRWHGVSNVRVLDAAWGQVLERRSVKAHVAGVMRRCKTQHKLVQVMRWKILVRATAERLDKLVMSSMRG